jgi:putative FmdB family regulatory protein
MNQAEAPMPHYIFICQDCRKEFEKVMHIAELDTAKPPCPLCGGTKVEQAVAHFSAVTSKKS